MANAFKIENLSLSLGDKTILKDLRLDLKKGAFNTILGLSGAGKTQFLRILAGLNPEVENPLGDTSTSFVFQRSQLIPWLTVLQNLMITTHKSAEEITAALDKLQLKSCVHLMPFQLSVGMQQKVNLLRAFLTQASVILLDEPFAGLDHANKSQLHADLLNLWNRTQCTIVYVTHDLSEALTLSENIFLLSRHSHAIDRTLINSCAYPRRLTDVEFKNYHAEKFVEIEQFLTQDFR